LTGDLAGDLPAAFSGKGDGARLESGTNSAAAWDREAGGPRCVWGSKTLIRVMPRCLLGPKRWRESCRAAMVLMDESAENVAAADLRPGYRLGTRSGVGRLKVRAAMRSDPVVVLRVRAEDALQVASTEDEDVVETLSSNGADPSLSERVRPRRTGRVSSPP
jgi:hypothetical protein